MIEFQKIISLFDKIDLTKTGAAMATVVKVYGSAYRRTGARMLITEGGEFVGTISGGCLEGDALVKAKKCIKEQKPVLITYDTRDDSAKKVGANLGCNGIIDIYIEPISENSPAILQIKEHLKNNIENSTALIYYDSYNEMTGNRINHKSSDDNNIQDELRKLIRNNLQKVYNSGRSVSISHELGDRTVKIFYESLKPQIKIVIFGSGLDSYPLISIAKNLGWNVSITSDSYSITESENFRGADEINYIDREAILNEIEINERTYCILISHNHKYDFNILKSLITTNTPYIGILGPTTRFEKLQEELRENGIILTQEQLSRIYNPIGLDIGGHTPEEISLSILSEIQAVIYGKSGKSLKFKQGPIHDRKEN